MPEQKNKSAFISILKNHPFVKKAKCTDYLHVNNNFTFSVWIVIKKDLMTRYGVSEQALRYRLQQLDLAKFEFNK